MDRKLFYGSDARQKLLKGVDTLYQAVSTTLGAKGKTVLIEDKIGGFAQITKDGVTVARNISVPGEVERVAVDLVRSISLKTNEMVGDGTTSSVVLANALIRNGFEAIDNGADVNQLVEGIRMATEDVNEQLKKLSLPVANNLAQIENVATVSANNDARVGKLIAEAYDKVNLRGIVTVDNSNSPESFIEVVNGMKLDSGLFSPVFLGSEGASRGYIQYNNPAIIITDFKVNSLLPFTETIQELLKEGMPVVLIVEDIDMGSLQILAHQKSAYNRDICVLKAPYFGQQQSDLLEDLAIVTGGKFLSEQAGYSLKDVTADMAGSCDKFEAGVEYSNYYNGHGDEELVEQRIALLKSSKVSEQEQLENEKRIASMDGGAATIYVGSWSDTERSELRDRVIDAVHSVKSAITEGIVPGGGSALYYISKKLMSNVNEKSDFYIGYKTLCLSIQSTLECILKNAGISDLSKIENAQKNMGIDVRTGEKVNMVKAGVIDPTKVVRVSLHNAVSVATTLLTTQCVVSNLYAEGEGSDIF